MNAFVYIRRCADGSYYVGSTRASLAERIAQHNFGHFGGYNAKRRPVTLAWTQNLIGAARRRLRLSRAILHCCTSWRNAARRHENAAMSFDCAPRAPLRTRG